MHHRTSPPGGPDEKDGEGNMESTPGELAGGAPASSEADLDSDWTDEEMDAALPAPMPEVHDRESGDGT